MKIKTTLKWSLAAGAAVTLFSSCVDTYGGGPGYGGPVYQPGYAVDTLPGGYVSEYYGGERYYVVNDVYYRREHGRYIVAERPRGARPPVGRPGYGRPGNPGYGHPGGPGYGRPGLPGGPRPETMSVPKGDHHYSGGSHTESFGGQKPGGFHGQGNGPKGPGYEKTTTTTTKKKVTEQH